MGQTTGRAFGGFVPENPEAEHWVRAIGKLVINFTSVEFLSFVWIDTLGRDPLLHEVALERPFAARLDLINRLIDRIEVPDEAKDAAKSAWAEAKKISELRNQVVHNPIAFTWKTRGAEGPHDFIGIPELRKLRRNESGIVPSISLAQINHAVDYIVDLAPRIHATLAALTNCSSTPPPNQS